MNDGSGASEIGAGRCNGAGLSTSEGVQAYRGHWARRDYLFLSSCAGLSIITYFYSAIYIYFYHQHDGWYIIYFGLFIFSVAIISFIMSIKNLLRGMVCFFLIDALVFIISIVNITFPSTVLNIDMNVKGFVFGLYPSLCGYNSDASRKKAIVCYRYIHGYSVETLVYDRSDEMNQKFMFWDKEIYSDILGSGPRSPALSCEFVDTKKVSAHIYYISDRC